MSIKISIYFIAKNKQDKISQHIVAKFNFIDISQ